MNEFQEIDLPNLLPPLSEEEYSALKASIQRHGVQVPIIVDPEQRIIDGHHRQRACNELGVDCPQQVREFGSAAERLELAISLNCQRRQLTRKQKRELIAVYLRRDPKAADSWLGEMACTSKNTVTSVRRELESTGEIPKHLKLRGKDGKMRPARYRSVLCRNKKEGAEAGKLIPELPERDRRQIYDFAHAKRRAETQKGLRAKKRALSEILRQSSLRTGLEAIKVYHCPFQQLAMRAGLQPDSVDLICTDIPYGRDFVAELESLVDLAMNVLKPGGTLASYVGHHRLDEKMRLFSDRLKYQWMPISAWDGPATEGFSVGVVSQNIPILVFSKGEWTKPRRWHDTFINLKSEKKWHPWERPLEEVRKLVSYFSNPGDLVVDPCAGGFTTAVACHQLNRQFVGCDCDSEAVKKGLERIKELARTESESD